MTFVLALDQGTTSCRALLFDGEGFLRFSAPRLPARHSHGTGCALASAIAALLSQGEPLPLAVERARGYVRDAIGLARPFGRGHGPVNHFLAAEQVRAEARFTRQEQP